MLASNIPHKKSIELIQLKCANNLNNVYFIVQYCVCLESIQDKVPDPRPTCATTSDSSFAFSYTIKREDPLFLCTFLSQLIISLAFIRRNCLYCHITVVQWTTCYWGKLMAALKICRLKSLHDSVVGMCSAGSSTVNILHPPPYSLLPGPGIPHPSNGRLVPTLFLCPSPCVPLKHTQANSFSVPHATTWNYFLPSFLPHSRRTHFLISSIQFHSSLISFFCFFFFFFF